MEIRNKADNPSGIWVFDIEADNLYHGLTVIHCIWMICPVTKMALGFKPDEIEECIPYLEDAKLLIAHNGIDFDIPAMRKIYKIGPVNIIDTLILSSMLQPNLLSQALGALTKHYETSKDTDFGKNADWSVFTEKMYEYCYDDTASTVCLVLDLCSMAGIEVTDLPAYKM